MLEHQKIVLRGVGHDKRLFRKELIKSMGWLDARDQTELRRWVYQNFQTTHPEIIEEVLYPCYDKAS